MTEGNNKSGEDVGSESITYIQTEKSVGTEPVRNEELQKTEAEFQETDSSLGTAYFENFEEPGKFRSIAAELDKKARRYSRIAIGSIFASIGAEGLAYALSSVSLHITSNNPNVIVNAIDMLYSILIIGVAPIGGLLSFIFSILAYNTKQTEQTENLMKLQIVLLAMGVVSIINGVLVFYVLFTILKQFR